MVNLPFSGHSNPTMGLARELHERGHEVGYIHSYEWEDRVRATGCQFIPYKGTTPDKYKKAELNYWRVAYDTVEAELGDYDLLIYEVLFFPGKSLADKLGKPCVRLFSTFALNANILRAFGLSGGPYITMLFRYNFLYKPLSVLVSRSFQLARKDIVQELTANAPELNFTYTSRDFQMDNASFPEDHYRFVGPSLSGRSTPTTGTEIDYTQMKRPIIYLSMGTMVNHSSRFYQKCFEAFGHKDLTLIIALGHGVKSETFKDVPANIKLYSYVPQLEVLEHCDLFITHGGMNSVNEAIWFGVPMLVIPIGNDQPTVARRVEETGLGRTISAKKTSAAALYQAAIDVLHNTRQPVLQAMKEKSRSAGGNQAIADTIICTYAQLSS
jgi:MGT family glycosyltransferase